MRKILSIIAVTFLFISCEKVIDVDINEENKQVVIEAPLFEGTNDFKVTVNKTSSYFNGSAGDAVVDALVTLYDENDTPFNVPHNVNGEYILTGYTALASKSYRLDVQLEGEIYSASSFLPPAVNMDTVEYEFVPATPFSDSGYAVASYYMDPANEDNYYRVLLTLNGEFMNDPFDLILIDDRYSDGLELEIPFFFRQFELGDTLDVELRSMDQGPYEYFQTLADIIGSGEGPQPAAPTNPNSNISNGALGYFGAFSRTFKRAIIK